jgi:hypothetical protein
VVVQSPQPVMSVVFVGGYIDRILAPVLQITLEQHELCGDSSVVHELLELGGGEVMPPSVEEVHVVPFDVGVAKSGLQATVPGGVVARECHAEVHSCRHVVLCVGYCGCGPVVWVLIRLGCMCGCVYVGSALLLWFSPGSLLKTRHLLLN